MEELLPLGKEIFVDGRVWAMDFEKVPMPSPYAQSPFLLFEEATVPEACRRAVADLGDREAVTAALRGRGHDSDIRDTALLALTPEIETLYESAVAKHREAIERFFGVALASATRPQLLEYRPGGRYRRHADNASELVDSAGRLVGYKTVIPERKVTTLLFLSTHGENFEGGELLFNHLRNARGDVVKLLPRAGTLLAFPSHGLFAHEVLPVTKGRRLAVAQWHDAL